MSEHENFWRRVSDDPRKVHSPLALLAVPQYGRDDAEPREPLVRVFHAFVLVRAVAIVASVPGPRVQTSGRNGSRHVLEL